MDKETKKEIAQEVTRQVLRSIKVEVIPAVEESIQKTVNGKIDKLHEKLDTHTATMEPILKAYEGANNAGNFVIWISKVFLAVGAIVATIKLLR